MNNNRTLPLCAMALGFTLMSGTLFAQQQPAATEARSRPQVVGKDVAIPTCLEKLALTQQQQDRIQEIVREYDADQTMAWKEFGDRYMESIRTEVLLLCAIEDNLTEAQRQQLRAQRRTTAQHQQASSSTEGKSNNETTRPDSAVEEGLAIVGVSLTAKQKLAADKLQENYLSQLRSLNRDIEGLHIQLVSLEADKFVEIEKILTEDQLQQLREIRQTAPAKHAAITTQRTSPAQGK